MSWEVDFSCYGTEQELTASRCYQRNTFKLCLMQTFPSTKCKFLAVTWVAGGLTVGHIVLKSISLFLYDNLLLFFFLFKRSTENTLGDSSNCDVKCSLSGLRQSYWLLKSFTFQQGCFWGQKTLSTEISNMACISSLRWDAVISPPKRLQLVQ